MGFTEQLKNVQNSLSDEQEEEQEIVNAFKIFEKKIKELPKEFELEFDYLIATNTIETFLREQLELDVKEVTFRSELIVSGRPKFRIILN